MASNTTSDSTFDTKFLSFDIFQLVPIFRYFHNLRYLFDFLILLDINTRFNRLTQSKVSPTALTPGSTRLPCSLTCNYQKEEKRENFHPPKKANHFRARTHTHNNELWKVHLLAPWRAANRRLLSDSWKRRMVKMVEFLTGKKGGKTCHLRNGSRLETFTLSVGSRLFFFISIFLHISEYLAALNTIF